jgi:hypothetical protein
MGSSKRRINKKEYKMKIKEISRLQLENIILKLKLIQNQAIQLNQETEKLQNENNKIIKDFCDTNQLDITKTNIDVSTGEVTIIEEEKKEI